MKKKILIGCLIVACVMMILPSTTVAESNSVEDRIKLREKIQEQIEETLDVTDGPHEPDTFLLHDEARSLGTVCWLSRSHEAPGRC